MTPDDDDGLDELLAAERGYEETPGADVRARVRGGVLASAAVIGVGGPGTPAAAGKSIALSRAALGMLGTFVLGGVLGAVVMRGVTPRPQSTSAPRVTASIASTAPSAVVESPVIELPDLPPSATPSAVPPPDDGRRIAAERALLDAARVSLANGEPEQTMSLVDRHEREFAHGRLVEEREALAIRALVKQGREGEARARAARFRRTWPQSLAMPAVDAAIASLPGGR